MQKFSHIFAYMKLSNSFNDFEAVDELGPSFIGLQLYQLLSVINVQGNKLLKDLNLEIPSRVASSLMLLKINGPMSVTQLGSTLNMSHQLMAHRIKTLKELKLIIQKKDPNDGRRMLFHLTYKGDQLASNLQKVSQIAIDGYMDLYEELDVNLYEALIKARKLLLKKPLYERIKD